MKSQELAEQTYKNLCNKSSSKYQYSFGKEQRFKQRILKTEVLDKFYDLPSQVSRRGIVFGKDKRDCDRQIPIDSVPSWNYNPKEVRSTSNIVFAPGREVEPIIIRTVRSHQCSTTQQSPTLVRASTTQVGRRASLISSLLVGQTLPSRPSVQGLSTTSSRRCWTATKSFRRRSGRAAAALCSLPARAA
jgi:hypothetical protein